MAEETPQKIGPRKHLSKRAAIAVMVAGALMILTPWWLIPAEQGSTLQIVKVLIGLAGFVVLCLGSYYRP